jgi:hypothetical protein
MLSFLVNPETASRHGVYQTKRSTHKAQTRAFAPGFSHRLYVPVAWASSPKVPATCSDSLGEDAQATGSRSPELSFQDFVDTNEFSCVSAVLGFSLAKRTCPIYTVMVR